MKHILILPLLALSLSGYSQNQQPKKTVMKKKIESSCTESCGDNCSKQVLACKLTSPEMQERKATVIASLRKKIIEKKEISNGFSYKFKGTDEVLDELSAFIKTERLCCDFFDFTIKANGDASYSWLTISGPKGAKEFIKTELEL